MITKESIIELIHDAGISIDLKRLGPDSNLKDVGMDSLDRANLCLRLEQRYEIEIPDEDLPRLSSIIGIIKYISEKIERRD